MKKRADKMVDSHENFRQNLAAYALGALEPGEAAALEAHLRRCKTCPVELQDYRAISAGLLTAVPPVSPPPALRRNLQARVMLSKTQRPRFSWSFERFAL